MAEINFTPFPSITTQRFKLRQLKMEDDNEIFAIRSDEDVAKYLDRPQAKTIDDARQFITKINNGIDKNEWIFWAIVPRNEHKLVGRVCLWNITEDKSTAEIGFELSPDAQGKGIMQEVLPKIIEYGFEEMNLQKIEGDVDPNNIKSIKLMEKYGFVYERKLENMLIYSLKK